MAQVTHARKFDDSPGLRLPRILLQAFAVGAAVLLPWSVWLSYSLPSRHIDREWNLAWSGFDIGLLLALAATAYFGFRRSIYVIMSSAAAGAFLLIDAWFDCLTSGHGFDYIVSLIAASFVELPFSLVAFWMAYRATRFYITDTSRKK